MTYRGDFTLPAEILEQIAEQGFEALPELIRIVVNAAMQTAPPVLAGAAPVTNVPLPCLMFWNTAEPGCPSATRCEGPVCSTRTPSSPWYVTAPPEPDFTKGWLSVE